MPNRVYQVFPLVGTTILLPDGKPAGLPFRGIPSLDQSEILVVSGTEVQGVSTVDPVALAASAAWEFDPSRLAQVPVPGLVDPGPDPDPDPPSGEWRANEPEGTLTFGDLDWDGVTIVVNNPPWFSLDGAEPFEGAASFEQVLDYVEVRSDGNGPISPPHMFRFNLFEGQRDGEGSAGIFANTGLSVGPATGIYWAFAMRLSSNWNQGETPVDGNTFKHVEFYSDAGNLVSRTAITKIPNDPQDRFRFKLANWQGGGTVTHVLDDTTAWHRGEWVTQEFLCRYNNGGPNTGSMEMWVNGHLAAYIYNSHLPYSGVASIGVANIHGGGIGDVTEDKWYDFDHFYAARVQ